MENKSLQVAMNHQLDSYQQHHDYLLNEGIHGYPVSVRGYPHFNISRIGFSERSSSSYLLLLSLAPHEPYKIQRLYHYSKVEIEEKGDIDNQGFKKRIQNLLNEFI